MIIPSSETEKRGNESEKKSAHRKRKQNIFLEIIYLFVVVTPNIRSSSHTQQHLVRVGV